MRVFFAVATVSLLSACSGTLGDFLANDLACSPAGSRAYFISSYGSIGISSEVKKKTSEAVCKKEPPAPAAKKE